MAEEVTEKQQDDAATEQQTTNETVTEKVTVIESKSKGGLWIVIIVLLIVLLAGASFYFLQQLRDKQDAQSDQIAKEDQRAIELTKQFSNIQSQLTTVQSQLASVDEDVTGSDKLINKKLSEFTERQNEKLEITQTELKRDIAEVKRQLSKTRGDWLLADAEYLLSVANQRLHLTGDVNTAREALKAADQRLRESGDAGGFKVREQIAKEIAELNTVEIGDIVGSYSALQLLIEKVDSLSLILPYSGKPLAPSKEVHSHTQSNHDEHGLLNLALKQVEGYVTVRHVDQPVDQILTPLQAQFIKQQLSIKLEMIKIALVQQNKNLYSTSIDDAQKWLKDHFTLNEMGKSFITELEQLKTTEIYSELPDISLSLKMLRDISKLRIENDKALDDSDSKESSSPSEEEPTVKNTPNKPVKTENSTDKELKPSSSPDAVAPKTEDTESAANTEAEATDSTPAAETAPQE